MYRCGIVRCNRGTSFCYAVKLKDGTPIFLPYCDKEEHFLTMTFQIKEAVKKSDNKAELKNIKNLSISRHIKPTVRTIAKKQYAFSDWEWIIDFDCWMNVKGETVKIRDLSDKELEDAVITIRKNNIKKVTRRIHWIKELETISTPVLFIYPEEQLRVDDIEDAYTKLEEFYEVLVEKELLA
jgi:hypothetical protein